MRRRHNVIAATLFLLGIIYLCAQREGDLLDHVRLEAVKEGREPDRTTLRVGGSHAAFNGEAQLAATLQPSPSASISLDTGVKTSLEFILPETLIPSDATQASQDGANLPPSDESQQEPEGHSTTSSSEVEYSFQHDLNLNLPLKTLQKFSNHVPHHYNPNGHKTYAFATFMATRNPSLKDPYFLAIHSLIHRILWSPRSRTQKKYPFIVFVADFVTQEQRALLSGAGAVIHELKPLKWHCDSSGVQKRWNDLFAKLNMWVETDFERILFLDADAFPLANLDKVFDIAPVQNCIEEKLQIDDFLPNRTPICDPYIFAGVPQSPFNAESPNINVGSMVFTPSLAMHARLVQNYLKTDHYDCSMAEQAFLNWQFSPQGAYPPTKLDREWGGFFPSDEEEGKLKIVHEKIWVAENGWLRKEWERGWEEMRQWYESEEFVEARRDDGVREGRGI